jgi:mRNA interferase RelE/StbE
MEILYTNRFKKDYKKLSLHLRKVVKDKILILQNNPMHPSLRTKKIKRQ